MERVAVEDLDRAKLEAFALHLDGLVNQMVDLNNALMAKLAEGKLTDAQLVALNAWGLTNNQLTEASDAWMGRLVATVN